jgi:hypothetical protein
MTFVTNEPPMRPFLFASLGFKAGCQEIARLVPMYQVIDNYALIILDRPDDQVTLIALGVSQLGGLVCWGTDRSTKRMARGR